MSYASLTVRSWLILIRKEWRHHVVGVAVLAALALALGFRFFLDPGPVISSNFVVGRVESAALAPVNPEAAVGSGLRYIYDVEIGQNARVSIDGDVGTPYPTGSEIRLLRLHHENGADTYQIVDEPISQ